MSILKPIDLPWDDIDTVLLDMDGTLLDLHFDNYFWVVLLPEVYAKESNISLEESQLLLQGYSNDVLSTLNWYCLDYWTKKLNLDIPKLKRQAAEKIIFRPNAKEFLQSLRDRGKQIILATNAHPKALELKDLKTNFSEYFDHLSSSHEFGYPKEEQQYWHLLTKRYSLAPKKCLFVDDSVKILKSAEAFGIGHLLGIRQPDSHKSPADCSPYTGIHDFSQLL